MERVAVLHVDSAARGMLKSLVEARGLSAIEVDSIASLGEAASSGAIALLLVDVATLRALGLEALRIAAMGDRPHAHVPVVLLAARGDALDGPSDLDGVDELLWEPVHARELALRVESGLARRRTTELVAVASHELRSPIHAIVAFLDLLARSELASGQREMVEGARTASRHLIDLVEDLLEHARLGQGPVELAAAPFSLSAILSEATFIALEASRPGHVGVTTNIADGVPDVFRGDGPRVRQILINLISNALKFASTEAVRVDVQRANGFITFEVADDGPGVPESARALVFEPFRQGDPSVTQRFGGTGLGLAIARSLARRMGGDIEVRAAADEGAGPAGAVFVVTLRLDPLMEGRVSATKKERPLALLADGDAIHRGMVASLLERLGYRVDVVSEGVAAIMHALEHRPALVVIDADLAVLSAIEVAQRLRSVSAMMPIVGFARDASDELRARCIAAGMSGVLAKPVTPLLLQRVLREASSPVLRTDRTSVDPKVDDPSGERTKLDPGREMRDALLAIVAAVEHHGQALDAAMAKPDLPAVTLIARTLRGAVLALNARGLEAVLRDLEQAAVAGDAEEARRAHVAWRAAAASLRENVERFLERTAKSALAR